MSQRSRFRVLRLLLAPFLFGGLFALDAEETIRALDPNLEISLYAADPDIVTPIGAATDQAGNLYVVESHTHVRPQNYSGPAHDRIKRFSDQDGDGRADEISIFAEGLDEAMNLAFAPDGTLHVITASDVIRLTDKNGDGQSEAHERTVLLHLETLSGNPHGDLLAIAIDESGTIYASRGNVGGYRYEWQSRAGESLSGYGDGGDIVRIDPDGSGLHRVATGFWNPFALGFDHDGRLLCADNDPDSRGPNRVVHIIDGGDYGFLARYGPTGLHPFSAWNGELPGTLPILAGTGEAPSGILDLKSARLGQNYSGTFAATIWGEHKLSLFRPAQKGFSLQATAEPWIEGGDDFRPVALAPAKDGGFFITDWVLREYPNHSRGAIWLVRPKRLGPIEQATDSVKTLIDQIRWSESPKKLETWLNNESPFLRTSAVAGLAERAKPKRLIQLLADKRAENRQGGWLALRMREHVFSPHQIEVALSDSSEELRLLALREIGDRVIRSQRGSVANLLQDSALTPRLFRSALATLQILDSDVDVAYAAGNPTFRIGRQVAPALIEEIVLNSKLPDDIRALAVPQLPIPLQSNIQQALRELLSDEHSLVTLKREAMRTLISAADSEVLPILNSIVQDTNLDAELRADAISSLSQLPGGVSSNLSKLLDDSEVAVKRAAERALQSHGLIPLPNPTIRPPDLTGWNALLAEGGSAAAGNRVFHETKALCITCHRVNNRGSEIGPDLSRIGATLSRRQLIRSIIQPSDDISPEFQGWEILLKNGGSHVGLQGHLRGWGILLTGFDGETIRVRHEDIADYRAMDRSLMPDGLGQILPPEDLLNLIAYLETLR